MRRHRRFGATWTHHGIAIADPMYYRVRFNINEFLSSVLIGSSIEPLTEVSPRLQMFNKICQGAKHNMTTGIQGTAYAF
jgi:hypothetical protein